MPNEVGAPTISPSALQPAPKPAAAPVAAPPPAEDIGALKAKLSEYESRLSAADKKLRVNGIEVMKVATEKKALGAKLAAHDQMEKAMKAAGVSADVLARAKANPEPLFRAVLGDDYYEKVVEMRINGGAPTGAVLASELAAVEERAEARVMARLAAEKEAAAAAAAERDQQARAQIADEASAYLSKSKAEYPGFEAYPADAVSKAVAQYIEHEWSRTGKVLTNKEAADKVEWNDVAARFARGEDLAPKTLEKYRPQLKKLTEKLEPANVAPVAPKPVGQASRSTEVERRTLSNDLTATTPTAKRTHRTDEERMAAIKALNLDR